MNLAAPVERLTRRFVDPSAEGTVVIFSRLGPYHCARLAAASQETPIIALEVAGETSTYAWEKVSSGLSFRRRTLFPKTASETLRSQELETALRSELDSLRPSVVAIPGWSDRAALLALHWCAQTGVPALVMSESTAWDEPRKPWKEWAKKRIVGLCSAGCVGGSAHAHYLSELGMPRDRIFVGYDCVDNQYFADGAAKVRRNAGQVRSAYKLPENYFLASARFVKKKNLAGLIQAYAQYRQLTAKNESGSSLNVEKPWDLVLLGDGGLKPELQRLIAQLSLEGHVHLPGFKQYAELPAYYALAGAFVHASLTEQWGLVVNEAMASDLPVLVSSRCGCASDLMRDGMNGFIFDPRKPEDLAHLMKRMAAYPSAAREKMGRVSGKIISRWGQERFARGLVKARKKAIEIGAQRASPWDSLLLRALCRR